MGMRGHGGGPMRRLSMEKKKAARPIGVLLKSLGGFFGKYKGLLVASGIISLIYAGTQIINPILLSMGIDSIDPANFTKYHPSIINAQTAKLIRPNSIVKPIVEFHVGQKI